MSEACLEGTRLELHLHDAKTGKDGSKQFHVPIKPCHLVILFPSLGCPALLHEGEPLRLMVLTDDTFHKAHRDDPPTLTKARGDYQGKALRRAIARCLKLQSMDVALKDKATNTKQDKPLCKVEDAFEHIGITYLGHASDSSAAQALKNTDTQAGDKPFTHEMFIGHLRADTAAYYEGMGLRHLFQIDIHQPDVQAGQSGRLYDLSWIIANTDKSTKSKEPYVEPEDQYVLTFLDQTPYISTQTTQGKKRGKQDEALDLTLAFQVDQPHLDFTADPSQPVRNYHPVWVLPAAKKHLSIGHLSDVHISARHYAFRKTKAQLIPGVSEQIGPMVNASFDTLKDLMDQFGTDPDIDLLFITGDLIDYNRNYNPKPFVTGAEGAKTTGDLWSKMMLKHLNELDAQGQPVRDTHDNIVPNIAEYPRSIDDVLMYSLVIYYLKKYKKPIFFTSGNHEAYSVPYGISPRIDKEQSAKHSSPWGWTVDSEEDAVEKSSATYNRDVDNMADGKALEHDTLANSGIPADHNLTMPEAILMYGPGFAEVVMDGMTESAGWKNFNSENYDWFYMVFTPFADYAFSWNQQRFIALAWGNDEKDIGIFDDQTKHWIGGAMLPRADDSITDSQKRLIEQTLRTPGHEGAKNLLFCHFTIANFADSQPINARGKLYSDRPGKYDMGTFSHHRTYVHSLLYDERLHYTFSGHSHRSALYQIQERQRFQTDLVYDTRFQIGTLSAQDYIYDFAVEGQAPRADATFAPSGIGTRLIVSACGGPVPVQNHDGELAARGRDVSSGSYVKFDASSGQEQAIGIKRTTVKQARPRLAVALDFADLMAPKDDNGVRVGIFSRFEQEQEGGPFIVEVNPKMGLPQVDWIEKISLYKLNAVTKSSSQLNTIILYQNNRYELRVEQADEIKKGATTYHQYFIRIQPRQGALFGHAFEHYDQQSPWVFQIEVLPRRHLLQEQHNRQTAVISNPYAREADKSQLEMQANGIRGLAIRRHPKFGEKPYLPFYSQNWPNEYQFNWSKKDFKPSTKQ